MRTNCQSSATYKFYDKMNKIKWKWTAAVLVLLLIEVNTFYALGNSMDFKKGQKIDVEVAKMFSLRTQLSYEYYSLPFCLPKNGALSYKSENLGEMLRGDIIVNTPYEVAMAQNISCKLLCDEPTEPMTWKESNSSLVIERIQQEYIVHLLIDDFTAASLSNLNDKIYIQPGYYLGGIDEKNRVYINNYLKLKVAYHKYGENKFKVVGSIVEALSVDYKQVGYNSGTCNIPPQASPQYVNPNGTKIQFFYSVEWKEEPNISWASRWDIYVTTDYIHWRWVNINWLTYCLLFFSGITFVLLYDQVGKDIAKYNNCDSIARLERAVETTGWDLVYADVFRPPTKSLLFAAVIGSGIQVFVTISILVFFFALGIFQSASRGAVGTWAIYCFSLSGLVAGYFSGRLYKTMQGKRWKKAAFLTATLYPGIALGTYLLFNFFSWEKHNSGSVLFSTMISLLCIWFGISLLLVYVGYFFGYHKKHFTHPTRTKQKPSKIPDQVWYLNPIVCMVTGVLLFSIVFIDLFYILTALWQNYLYVVSEFSFIIFIYLVISCSETSMIIVYFHLRNEDYRWWWRCFMYSGASAVYLQAFSIYFFFIGTNITELVPTLMYFVYTSLIAITFWLLTGTISFFAAFIFIRKMYAAIKLA